MQISTYIIGRSLQQQVNPLNVAIFHSFVQVSPGHDLG